MDTFADRVTLLQSESARIKQYLHTLPPNAWTRPSACERWEVRDVVGHLIAVAELYANGLSRGLQEDIAPRQAYPLLAQARAHRSMSLSPRAPLHVGSGWESRCSLCMMLQTTN